MVETFSGSGTEQQRERERGGNRESQSGDPAAGVFVREDGNATTPTATRPREIVVDVEGSDEEEEEEEDKKSGDWIYEEQGRERGEVGE